MGLTAPVPGSELNITRRRFLGAAATSTLCVATGATAAFAADEKPIINIGLIGCGGRGKWIAGLFQKHGGYHVAAVADYFQDKADAAGNALNIPAGQRFTGLNGYRRLLEQKLEAVVIESPPYFHPEQAAAAVAARKHVYLAKPLAVDVPGCHTVDQSAQRATQNNRVFLVDFQTRTHPLLQEFAGRLRQNELGAIFTGEAGYHTGLVGETVDKARRADPKNRELRLRAWVTDKALSGDVIVEQNIHAIDMACWLLDAAPVSAYGMCGKQRDFIGNCHDHFCVVYEFPNGLQLSFNSKQAGFGIEGIHCRLYGESGTVEARYSDKVYFKSKEEYREGEIKGLYGSGAEANIATFHDAIMNRDYRNPTVAASVRSNLAAILGRTAAYHRRRIAWKDLLAKNEPVKTDLHGLKT